MSQNNLNAVSGGIDYLEVARERQRALRAGFVQSGIYMSSEHQKFEEDQQAAEAAKAAEAVQSPRPSAIARPQPPARASTSEAQASKAKVIPNLSKREVQMYSDNRKVWRQFEATFDTGTTENWISIKAVERMKYPVENVPKTRYSTFNGQTMESSKIVRQVRWCIDDGGEPSPRSRWSDFRIAPKGAPFMVLFGRDLIFSQDIFCFNEPALILTKLQDTAADKKTREDNKTKADIEARALEKRRQVSEGLSKPEKAT